jgi:hypothetical protein
MVVAGVAGEIPVATGRIPLSSFLDAYLPPLLFQANDATSLCLVD